MNKISLGELKFNPKRTGLKEEGHKVERNPFKREKK